MKLKFDRIAFQAKAVLCLLLTLHLQFLVPGCGTNGALLPAEQLRVPLDSNHPLNLVLKESPFNAASAVDIFPGRQSFSLVLPNKAQTLSGKYAFVDGDITITQFFIQNRGQSATLDLDNAKRVSRIVTSDGTTWKMPDTMRASDAPASGVDAYLTANSALLAVAQQLDDESAAASAQGSTSGSTDATPKPGNGLADPLRAVLFVFASILYPIAAIVPGLITVFTLATVLQTAMVVRFDGEWAANNAGNQLMVTINGGKISRLIDPSSGQEMVISNSTLEDLNGNHIVWKVDAGVLGQTTPVSFEFDVQEMSNGSLQGTLTTLGSTFARVPVTLTRS